MVSFMNKIFAVAAVCATATAGVANAAAVNGTDHPAATALANSTTAEATAAYTEAAAEPAVAEPATEAEAATPVYTEAVAEAVVATPVSRSREPRQIVDAIELIVTLAPKIFDWVNSLTADSGTTADVAEPANLDNTDPSAYTNPWSIYTKTARTVQDAHNDIQIFFQNGQVLTKNTYPTGGDADTADKCAQLCNAYDWCVSFDVNRVRGECDLSTTIIGYGSGGVAKNDPTSDYYEWNDAKAYLGYV